MTARLPQRRVRPLTSAAVDELVARRLAGEEIIPLAARFGVGRNTVMSHLRRRGVMPRRWPGRTLDPESLREAGWLYQAGVNLAEVADRFNVDRRYLRRELPRAGFVLRRPGRRA
jgi:DNA-binding transcriptional ArsR family regulator